MGRYSTQQNVNTKMFWRKVGSKLILNSWFSLNLSLNLSLTSHLTFRFCSCFKQGAPWHSANYRVRIHSKRVHAMTRTYSLEILFGLTHHSTKQYPQILQKYFFDWSIDIFQSLIDYIKFSTETQWRLVTTVCKICPKYTKGIIVRLHLHRVTNWHYVTVEKKQNVQWKVNAKL